MSCSIPLQRTIDLIPNFETANTGILNQIQNAAVACVEKYLNRTLAVTTYDEMHHGSGFNNLLLNNYPVVSVDRVMTNHAAVISVQNQSQTVQQARFRLDATNLILETWSSGTKTTRTISRSGNTTLTALCNAANAYSADGWALSALGTYGNYPTSELYSPQGGNEIRWFTTAYIFHHVFGVSLLHQNPELGEIVSAAAFMRGYNNYRVVYTAGFDPIPDDLIHAISELAAATYLSREVNPNLQSENLGGYSYVNVVNIVQKSFDQLSLVSKHTLQLYRNRRIPRYNV